MSIASHNEQQAQHMLSTHFIQVFLLPSVAPWINGNTTAYKDCIKIIMTRVTYMKLLHIKVDKRQQDLRFFPRSVHTSYH